MACWGPHVQEPQESSGYFLFSLCSQLRATWQWRGGGLGWAEEQKARFGARVTAGQKKPHPGVCPGPNSPLKGRQASRDCTPDSPGESGLASRGELRCWRRLLKVPWTARRSNQSILKEISPGCSLEGMMLKLKLQYFGHLMRRVDSRGSLECNPEMLVFP